MRSLLIFCTTLFLLACSNSSNDNIDTVDTKVALSVQKAEPVSFWDMSGVPEDESSLKLLEAMSPELRLAQLFMLSYAGSEPSVMLQSWLKMRGLGGVKIFGWNADNISALAKAIETIHFASAQHPLQIPPFIASDQEGGWIRHVKGNTSITAGNMAIAASGWTSDAYNSAFYIGQELIALGISMNFAPAVDLATNPDSKIIGTRAFSSEPIDTAVLAAAWVKGMTDAGVFSTAKHFPGHGATSLDSHGVLPVIDISEKTMWERELVPYRILVAENIPGVMTAHLAFPKVTGSIEPASLSEKLIADILRKRLGYDGIVITDDIMMAGVSGTGNFVDICEKAIRAGNDIIMMSRTLGLDDAAWTKLLALYNKDPAFKARVDESAKRVIKAKLKWLLPKGKSGILPMNNFVSLMRSPESQLFFDSLALRSVTTLSNKILPLNTMSKIIVASQFSDFFAVLSPRLKKYIEFKFSYIPTKASYSSELKDFSNRLKGMDAAIVCVADEYGAAFSKEVLRQGKKLYIISVLNPIHSLGFIKEASVIAVYSYSKASMFAAISALLGDFNPRGRFPIKLMKQ